MVYVRVTKNPEEEPVCEISYLASEIKTFHKIGLDDYAPEENKTALYLGPVKTRKGIRTIYLPERAIEALHTLKVMGEELAKGRQCFNPYNLIFCNEKGHPLEAKVLEEGFQTILKNLGIKCVNLHATRHTFATEALQKATDIIPGQKSRGI